MPDLSSIAREAAIRAMPPTDPTHGAFVAGFTECASRIPSEEEIARAMAEADGQVLSGMTGHMIEIMYGAQSRAVRSLIGEKISG